MSTIVHQRGSRNHLLFIQNKAQFDKKNHLLKIRNLLSPSPLRESQKSLFQRNHLNLQARILKINQALTPHKG